MTWMILGYPPDFQETSISGLSLLSRWVLSPNITGILHGIFDGICHKFVPRQNFETISTPRRNYFPPTYPKIPSYLKICNYECADSMHVCLQHIQLHGKHLFHPFIRGSDIPRPASTVRSLKLLQRMEQLRCESWWIWNQYPVPCSVMHCQKYFCFYLNYPENCRQLGDISLNSLV